MNFPDLPEVAPQLIFPDDGSIWLPQPSPDGMFPVTPHDLWAQLALGERNPHYNRARDIDEALEYLSAWHYQVMASDAAQYSDQTAILGSHFTNAIARIAMHPDRNQVFSLKKVFRDEELRAPRDEYVRDPADLSLLFHGIRAVRLKLTEQVTT